MTYYIEDEAGREQAVAMRRLLKADNDGYLMSVTSDDGNDLTIIDWLTNVPVTDVFIPNIDISRICNTGIIDELLYCCRLAIIRGRMAVWRSGIVTWNWPLIVKIDIYSIVAGVVPNIDVIQPADWPHGRVGSNDQRGWEWPSWLTGSLFNDKMKAVLLWYGNVMCEGQLL